MQYKCAINAIYTLYRFVNQCFILIFTGKTSINLSKIYHVHTQSIIFN